jgi:hypothetical protein
MTQSEPVPDPVPASEQPTRREDCSETASREARVARAKGKGKR